MFFSIKTLLSVDSMLHLKVGCIEIEGLLLGHFVGDKLGEIERVGKMDGSDDGNILGPSEGTSEGLLLGSVDGVDVGIELGDALGMLVGGSVGI